MKVVDLRKTVTKVNFADLPTGQTYFDEDKNLCIKTTTDPDQYDNCIFYRGNGWEEEHEEPDSVCELCSATITIEG